MHLEYINILSSHTYLLLCADLKMNENVKFVSMTDVSDH